MNPLFLFGGPSLYHQTGERLHSPLELQVFSPVQRGNVAYLVRHHAPSTIILIDGTFHHTLAVGHAELRDALQSGWTIWGLASMGAIRAWEMRTLGMRGYGQVYAQFAQQKDFQDDEVALLHSSEIPYRSMSEPLIHMRTALSSWQDRQWIEPKAATEIAARFKSLWYGERTLQRFQNDILSLAPSTHHTEIREDLQNFDQYRIKLHDVRNFLTALEKNSLNTVESE